VLLTFFFLEKVCSRGGDCGPHLISGCRHRYRSRLLTPSLAASESTYPAPYSLAHVRWLLAGTGNAPGVRDTFQRRRTSLPPAPPEYRWLERLALRCIRLWGTGTGPFCAHASDAS
jgi:hypothetical protein